MGVDGALLGLTLTPPLSQDQSGKVSAASTQPVETVVAPASTSLGHGKATSHASQSTSDHADPPPPPPHEAPLPSGALLDAGPAADKSPLAPKPKLKAKMGTVLKDSGHQTARLMIYNALSCRLYKFNCHCV